MGNLIWQCDLPDFCRFSRSDLHDHEAPPGSSKSLSLCCDSREFCQLPLLCSAMSEPSCRCDLAVYMIFFILT